MKKYFFFLSFLLFPHTIQAREREQQKFELYSAQGNINNSFSSEKSETQTTSLAYFQEVLSFDFSENLIFIQFVGLRYSNHQLSSITFAEGDVIDDINVNSLNLAINPELKFHQFTLGFNLDLLGFSFLSEGKERSSREKVSAPSGNLFLIAKNDIGALSSQTYLSYQFKSIVLVIGAAHNVIQLEDNKQGQKRQKFFDQNFIGLGFQF